MFKVAVSRASICYLRDLGITVLVMSESLTLSVPKKTLALALKCSRRSSKKEILAWNCPRLLSLMKRSRTYMILDSTDYCPFSLWLMI
jgi:hypothetical protein